MWSLPEGERPGQWHGVKGVLSLCANGIHVTGNPQAYWTLKARVFECEVRGEMQGDPYAAPGYKAAVRSCRLLRELSVEELTRFGIETARRQEAA